MANGRAEATGRVINGDIDLRLIEGETNLTERVHALEVQNLALVHRLESALEELISMADRAAAAEALIAKSREETTELMRFIESRLRLFVPLANHQDLESEVADLEPKFDRLDQSLARHVDEFVFLNDHQRIIDAKLASMEEAVALAVGLREERAPEVIAETPDLADVQPAPAPGTDDAVAVSELIGEVKGDAHFASDAENKPIVANYATATDTKRRKRRRR